MTTPPNEQPDDLEAVLELMITHAATSARDKTFKQTDIPSMAERMAHYYAPEVERYTTSQQVRLLDKIDGVRKQYSVQGESGEYFLWEKPLREAIERLREELQEPTA